jgi:hypothetical protein
MDQYSGEGLVLNTWPQLEPTKDGRWRRVWTIMFAADLPPQLPLEEVSAGLCEADFSVRLKQIGRREILATVLTQEWGWADHFYFASYRMLKAIEEKIGMIDTIQGQPRDLWRPWRK